MSVRQSAKTGNGITARRGLTHGFCETSRLMSMQHYMFANYFNLPDGFPRTMLSGYTRQKILVGYLTFQDWNLAVVIEVRR